MSFDVERARKDGVVVVERVECEFVGYDPVNRLVFFEDEEGDITGLRDDTMSLSNAPPPRPEHPVLRLFNAAWDDAGRSDGPLRTVEGLRDALAKRIEADPVEQCRAIGVAIVKLNGQWWPITKDGRVFFGFGWCRMWDEPSGEWYFEPHTNFDTPEAAARAALASPPEQPPKEGE